MKILVSLTALGAATFSFSCSNATNSSSDVYSTLQNTANTLSEKTDWTSELEGEILTAAVDGFSGLEKSIKLTTDAVSASRVLPSPVYPSIPGFASLDLTNFSPEQKKTVSDFCTALTEDKGGLDRFFKKTSVYALTLFLYDVRNYCKDESLFYGEEKSPFLSFILGEPFVNETLAQCPVRFTLKTGGELDIIIYLGKSDSDWKIQQIEFADGK